MKHLSSENRNDDEHANADPNRRDFIKSAAAAGALGTLGLTPAFARLTDMPSQQATGGLPTVSGPGENTGEIVQFAQVPLEDPKAPPRLKRPAMLGSKYTICYEHSVPAAMMIMTQYFSALSRRDLKGISGVLNYPHATYEGTNATIIQSAEELMDNPSPSMNVTGKGVNLIQPGSYDVMDNLALHIYNPIRVGLSLTYSRYEPSGNQILCCQGVYWVTYNNGKWGIELASTIFTPADQIHAKYPEATQAFEKWERDAWLAFTLNDRTASAEIIRSFGLQAGIPVQTGPDLFDAREGDPMMRYRTKGVKSRLVITDVPFSEGNMFGEATNSSSGTSMGYPDHGLYNGGGEAIGQYRGTMVVPWAHVLHASVNKAHVFTGLVRYTENMRRILRLRYINIYTMQRGRWGMATGGDPDHYLDYSDATDNVAS
jgi:TAT (twin-arginine translocation) pathway signal sequence